MPKSKTNYVSSITAKYGDVEQVKNDVKTLNEILGRQGSSLLIDVIAECAGETANKFKFHSSDRAMTIVSLVDELENALKERL
jgi:hypothetical protein